VPSVYCRRRIRNVLVTVTQRPSMPKFGRKVRHLGWGHTSFKVFINVLIIIIIIIIIKVKWYGQKSVLEVGRAYSVG